MNEKKVCNGMRIYSLPYTSGESFLMLYIHCFGGSSGDDFLLAVKEPCLGVGGGGVSDVSRV